VAAIAALTRFAVDGFTLSGLRRTFDTVAVVTPAICATSLNVAMFNFFVVVVSAVFVAGHREKVGKQFYNAVEMQYFNR